MESDKIEALKKLHIWTILSALIVASFSFILASTYTQYRLNGIDIDATRLKEITTPSLESLTKTKEHLDELAVAISDPQTSRESQQKVVDILNKTNESANNYLNLEILPGEHKLWSDLKDQLFIVRSSIQSLQSIENHGSQTSKAREQIQESQIAIGKACPFRRVS